MSKPIPPDIQDKMVEMFRSGSTYREIADELGFKPDQVTAVMGALGVQRYDLRSRYAEVFELSLQGIPTKEIAERTGLSRQSVEAIKSRQRHQRRKEFVW